MAIDIVGLVAKSRDSNDERNKNNDNNNDNNYNDNSDTDNYKNLVTKNKSNLGISFLLLFIHLNILFPFSFPFLPFNYFILLI